MKVEESAKTAITAEGKAKRSLARMVAVGKKEQMREFICARSKLPICWSFHNITHNIPQYYHNTAMFHSKEE